MTSTKPHEPVPLEIAQIAQLCAEHRHERNLRDGATITVRPLRADDREREAAFIESLSQKTRYMRLMTALRYLTPHLLDQLMDVDYRDRMAFIATCEVEGRESIIGVARYARAGEEKTIELGITVTDAWQRRGVAQVLLQALLVYARDQGFKVASSIVLPDNTRMLDLARRSGARVMFMQAEGLMRVEFPLSEPMVAARQWDLRR